MLRLSRRQRQLTTAPSPYRPPDPTPLPPLLPEPWRKHPLGNRAVLVATSAVLALVSPQKLMDIRRRENNYVNEIAASVLNEGIKEPFDLTWDDRGRICMRDGHHRTVIAQDNHIPAVPVVFTHTEVIRQAFSQPIGQIFTDVILALGEDERRRRVQEFALMALEDAGERGWSVGDAMCALKISLGLPVSDHERSRMQTIDPELAWS